MGGKSPYMLTSTAQKSDEYSTKYFILVFIFYGSRTYFFVGINKAL